jgi:hypothetical protein
MGLNNTNNGDRSFVAGYDNIVGNAYSFTSGQGLLNGNADGTNNTSHQTVLGKYNIASGSFTRITGNGTGDNARSNCETLSSAGELWTATDVMCGGVNQWGATHKLSEKISDAPEDGKLYMRRDGAWYSTDRVLPTTKLAGTVATVADLPSAPFFAEVVNGTNSDCLFKYYILYTDATSISGIRIEVSAPPESDTEETWFRNAENWSRTSSTNIVIDGATLADIGYTVDINQYGRGVTVANITFSDSVSVSASSTMSLTARTWGALVGGTSYGNEYTLTSVSFSFANLIPVVSGTAYYVTAVDGYYYYDGNTWVASNQIVDHSLLDPATQAVGGMGYYAAQTIRQAINDLSDVSYNNIQQITDANPSLTAGCHNYFALSTTTNALVVAIPQGVTNGKYEIDCGLFTSPGQGIPTITSFTASGRAVTTVANYTSGTGATGWKITLYVTSTDVYVYYSRG